MWNIINHTNICIWEYEKEKKEKRKKNIHKIMLENFINWMKSIIFTSKNLNELHV